MGNPNTKYEREGVVVNVYKESFVARLIDMTGNTPDEQWEILIECVPEHELSYLKVGARFHLIVKKQAELTFFKEQQTANILNKIKRDAFMKAQKKS